MAYSTSKGTYADRFTAMKKARMRALKLGHELGRFCRKRTSFSKWHRVEISQLTAACPCGMGVTVRWLPNGKALRFNSGGALEKQCRGFEATQ